MKRGIPCRHCGSPARTNPCWKKPRKGMCKGAHDQWLEDLAREAADPPLPRAVGLDEIMRRQARVRIEPLNAENIKTCAGVVFFVSLIGDLLGSWPT